MATVMIPSQTHPVFSHVWRRRLFLCGLLFMTPLATQAQSTADAPTAVIIVSPLAGARTATFTL